MNRELEFVNGTVSAIQEQPVRCNTNANENAATKELKGRVASAETVASA